MAKDGNMPKTRAQISQVLLNFRWKIHEHMSHFSWQPARRKPIIKLV